MEAITLRKIFFLAEHVFIVINLHQLLSKS